MAFNILLFSFEKKKNSTKRPVLSDGTTMSGEMKSDFSPLAPVVTFNLSDATHIPAYNYAYIAEFQQRYYFITDWLFVGGLWRATMAVDVLATYKDDILSSNQYVSRAKSLNPGDIIDASYPALTSITRQQDVTTMSSFWGTSYESGTIILGVVGSSSYTVGANTYYAMSVLAFSYFMGQMLNNPNWLNISATEISTDLQKALINPTQYITSCIWLPLFWEDVVYYDTSIPSNFTKTIRCGWWDFQMPSGEGTGAYTARILHNPLSLYYDYMRKTGGWSIQKHPQAATRGKWLNLSPYSKYTLYCPPFGVFDLDTVDLMNATTLTLEVKVHYYTGDAVLRVLIDDVNFPNQNIPILKVNANVGVQLPVGQIAMNLTNFDSALTAGAVAGISEIAAMWSENSATPVKDSSPSKHSTTSKRGTSR